MAEDITAKLKAQLEQNRKQYGTEKYWKSGLDLDTTTAYMADFLRKAGLTDINQLGTKTITIPEHDEEFTVGEGETATRHVPASSQQVYVNKDTGEEIKPDYDRARGNIFGGTFAGEGNTGYGVQFDAKGNPVFFTNQQSSSNLGDIAPLLTIASFIPGVAPFAMAANAAIAASQGDYLGAIAGAAGLGGFSDIATAARIGSAIDKGDYLNAVLGGMDLAGVNVGGVDLGGMSVNDMGKMVNLAQAVKSGDPTAILRATMGAKGTFEKFGVGSSAPGATDEYTPTKDFGVNADYSLFNSTGGTGETGLKAPTTPDVFNPDGSINYELFGQMPKNTGEGLHMPETPNLGSMGGGQGLVVPVDGGYLTEQGFIPTGYTPDLGDPNSFINKPAPDSGVKLPNISTKKPTTPTKTDTTGTPTDTGQNAGQGVTVVGSGQDNSADIQLMEDIFGTSLSAPSAGSNQIAKARELAALLRS